MNVAVLPYLVLVAALVVPLIGYIFYLIYTPPEQREGYMRNKITLAEIENGVSYDEDGTLRKAR